MLLVIPCRPVGVQITGISCMCVELYSLCDIPVYRDTLVLSKPGIIFPIPPNFNEHYNKRLKNVTGSDKKQSL